MKTKFLTALVFICICALPSYAQITTGEPSAKTIRTGNRAEKGCFGLYVGAKTSMFKDLFDSKTSVSALPLLNFKYMASNKTEIRLGFEWYQTSEKIKGDAKTGEDSTTAVTNKDRQSDVIFYPGIAYHFGRLNIFDVYVGAELPLGWNNARQSAATAGEKGYSSTVTKRSFVIGLGAFVGIQAYIANLPLALGIEYGISSRFDTGLKYKYEYTADNKTQTYYSPDLDSFERLDTSSQFTKLAAKKGTIGSQVRLTLTYYFK